MPFPLSDLKRSYGRGGSRGGPPEVRPYLLHGRELAAQRDRLQAVIAWHERQCGRPRAEVDFDELAQATGDYRLARCLAACLQTTYAYQAPSFEEAVIDGPSEGPAGRRRWTRLLEQGLAAPSALRRRLFERVSAAHGGFAPPAARAAIIAGEAERLGLAAAHLERLLWLDAEAEERLRRVGAPPAPEALAARYNRRAAATLLVRCLSADLVLPSPDGAAIRRLYFLVKRHGLVCDLELAQPARGAAGGVLVHLYGPLEVFGPRTRHGDRFAGLILALLGAFPALVGAARVLLNEREYQFHLDAGLAQAIRNAGESPDAADPDTAAPDVAGTGEAEPPAADGAWPADEPAAVVERPPAGPSFDSEVEAHLFNTLQGMERRRDTSGWRVEREPEPLIHEGTVLVPDFALSRADSPRAPATRVFVEVIGFWTPAYRDRKREKLGRLAGRVPLVLVAQEQLAAAFQDLDLPILAYKHRVSSMDLIRALNRAYPRSPAPQRDLRDRLERLLSAADPAAGFIPEADLRRGLEVPALDDLAEALRAGATEPSGEAGVGASAGWRVLPGVGACHEAWLAGIREVCAAALDGAPGEASSLDDLREATRRAGLASASTAADHLESLLPLAGFEVVWQSLFAATVRKKARP